MARFALLLAAKLGMTKREMMERMDSREFYEWQALSAFYPEWFWPARGESRDTGAAEFAAYLKAAAGE